MESQASNQSMALRPTRLKTTFAIALLLLSGASALSGVGDRRNHRERKPGQPVSQDTELPSPSPEDECVSVDDNDECLNELEAVRPEIVECFQSNGVLDLESRNMRPEHLAKPCYPRLARFARLSGTVEIEFVVDEAGNVIWADILRGHSLLRDSALKAVCVSSFRPASCGGRLIKAKERITYHFVPS